MQPSTRWPTLSPAWLQPPPRRRSLVLQRGHDTGGQGHWVTKARGGQGRRGFPQTPPPRRGRGAHSLCHHVPHVAGVQSGVLLLLLRRGVHGKELRIQRRRLPARAQDTALAPPTTTTMTTCSRTNQDLCQSTLHWNRLWSCHCRPCTHTCVNSQPTFPQQEHRSSDTEARESCLRPHTGA